MKYISCILLFASITLKAQQIQMVFNNTIDMGTYVDTTTAVKEIDLSELKQVVNTNEKISDKNLNIRVALFDVWMIGNMKLNKKNELIPDNYIDIWRERTKKHSEVLFLFVKDDKKYDLYKMVLSDQLEKEYEFPIVFINEQLTGGNCYTLVDKGIRLLTQSMKPLWALVSKLEGDDELTRAEANRIRDEYIEQIEDPDKKAEAYFKLQEKVTLVDPPNFSGIPVRNNDSVLLECFDAVNVIMERHYEELGMNYSVQNEPWTLATQDASNIYMHKDCYDKAVVQLDEALGQGMPVMVGVDWKAGGGNYDKITDHWVVITARRHDVKGAYYTYMEVAHRQTDKKDENFVQGTSTDRNRFYFDPVG
jgi:hypothetical protein